MISASQASICDVEQLYKPRDPFKVQASLSLHKLKQGRDRPESCRGRAGAEASLSPAGAAAGGAWVLQPLLHRCYSSDNQTYIPLTGQTGCSYSKIHEQET